LGGSDRNPVEILLRNLSGGTEENGNKSQVRIPDIPPEIVNKHLWNTNMEGYPGNNMLGVNATGLNSYRMIIFGISSFGAFNSAAWL
jgi:hypothetical protein